MYDVLNDDTKMMGFHPTFAERRGLCQSHAEACLGPYQTCIMNFLRN